MPLVSYIILPEWAIDAVSKQLTVLGWRVFGARDIAPASRDGGADRFCSYPLVMAYHSIVPTRWLADKTWIFARIEHATETPNELANLRSWCIESGSAAVPIDAM
jgi:hypothetical protein